LNKLIFNLPAGGSDIIPKAKIHILLRLYQALKHPFAKAAYTMLVISEIHPFLSRNERIARVMMNADLAKANQSKIIIPTVYRDDYLGALRRLTRQRDPKTYIRMLSRIHKFSSIIAGDNVDEMRLQLEKSNAFLEHTEGKLKFHKVK